MRRMARWGIGRVSGWLRRSLSGRAVARGGTFVSLEVRA